MGKPPADGGSMGAGVAEKGPGGLGDASIDYPLPFSTPLRASRIWLAQVHGLAGSGGGHRAGTRAMGGKRDGGAEG